MSGRSAFAVLFVGLGSLAYVFGGQCHRQFQDHSIDRFDVEPWLVSNLDAEVLPDFILWMGKPLKWKLPLSDTKTA
jgi:hypothetical protein